MPREPDCCPTCGRAFNGVQDFPRVYLLSFERLPVPESIDQMSAAAAMKRSARRRADPSRFDLAREDGINMTPAVADACTAADVQSYFLQLEGLVGCEVEPNQLLPLMKPHGLFRWAYPVAETGIFLSLSDAESIGPDERIAEIQVHCQGPNLGSAGGPTLQPLGAIARVHYRGVLNAA
jgi:hypothetical protein